MINPNKFVTPAAQEQGDSLWQGASTAQNFIDNRNNIKDAQDRSLPTPVPQENGSGLNLNGDPMNNKVSDTTFIPKNFMKFRQPPGGSSDISKFVNKGAYKVGEEIDEDDYSELGGKLDIHNITPVQTDKKEIYLLQEEDEIQILNFLGKKIPDVQKK